MGQYYKNNKIGTCESMYYLRLDKAKDLADLGAHDDDGISFKEYVEDETTRFRFPFPDEDDKSDNLVEIQNHEPHFKLPLGDVSLDVIEHGDKCVHVDGEGVSGANIFFPCPYSKEWRDNPLKTSVGGFGTKFILVKMQAIREGKVRTIFECPFCNRQFWLQSKEVKKLKDNAKDYFKGYDMTGKNPSYQGDQEKYDDAMELISRIS